MLTLVSLREQLRIFKKHVILRGYFLVYEKAVFRTIYVVSFL